MIPLRKSTASQEVLLGPFLDDTDGKTAETGLTIANTDIKLWKRGGTTESNKNSGGATHIADGRYYAVLDATDTDTVGELIINVAVTGALPVRLVCCVFEAAVFDALFASGAAGYQVPIWSSASATVNLSGTTIKAVTDAIVLPSSASINITGNITGNLSGSVGSVTGSVGSVTGNVGGSVASVTGAVGSVTGNVGGNVTGSVGSVASGVTVTTNNDKTGYSLTQSFPSNFASLAITAGGAVTAGTVSDKTGYSLTQSFPTNFSSLAITAGGSVTAGTVSDKTGYSLTQAFPTNFSSMAISASGVVDANTVLWGGSTLPTVGTSTLTASQVWSHATRTLTAFAFTPNVNVTQWDGGSLPTIGTSTLTASDVWTHATRTLTAFGFNVTVGTNNDKTGYVLTQAFPINFSSLAITAGGSVTAGTVSDKTGYSLTQAFPTNFSSLGINASGHISRVTLVDTTTANTDMRGTDGAALASIWTSTVAGRIDAAISSRSSHSAADVWSVATRTLTAFSFSVTVATNNDKTGYSLATAPLDASGTAAAVWGALLASYTTADTFGARVVRSTNSNNSVAITGANHVAADIHDLQPAVIEAQHFALGAVDANALAADAAAKVATAVRAELATELARIDVTVGSRLATTSYTAPPTATTVADAVLTRNVSNVETLAETTTLCTLVLAGVGKAITVGNTLNIYRTNGTTVHATKTLTTDPNADPVTGIS